MVLTTSIYAKTPAGQDEIKQRKLGLDQHLRTLLIMVDGKKTVQQLLDLASHFQLDANSVLKLEELHLISPKTSAAASSAASEPVAPISTEPRGAFERFSDGQRFLNQTARDALGLKAFFFTLKVERCANAEELMGLLDTYEAALVKAESPEYAQLARKTAERILSA